MEADGWNLCHTSLVSPATYFRFIFTLQPGVAVRDPAIARGYIKGLE